MRIALACLVVSACSQPSALPAKAPSQKVLRAPVSSTPTCADMGPLLRGSMDDEVREGPKKEALIIASCERDRWPASVLACAASATEPTVQDCLDQLPAEMHASYDKALETYGGVAESDPDDRVGDDVEETTCDVAFAATSVDTWPPAVVAGAERPLATRLRGLALRKLCEDQWEVEAKRCIAATPSSLVMTCFDKLGDAQAKEVTRVVAEADSIRARIVKAWRTPASSTCQKVVAAHYAPARWVGKAPTLKGAARTKAIALSKKAMLAACKGWSLDVRSCIAAEDREECYVLGGTTAVAWGYPATSATSTMVMTGIAECDDYARAVERLSNCTSISSATREAVMNAYNQTAKSFPSLSGDALDAAKSACKAAADATRQAAAGCT